MKRTMLVVACMLAMAGCTQRQWDAFNNGDWPECYGLTGTEEAQCNSIKSEALQQGLYNAAVIQNMNWQANHPAHVSCWQMGNYLTCQ